MSHTKGPWKFDTRSNEIWGKYFAENRELQKFIHVWRGSNEDAARIVACVNACEGIEDPAKLDFQVIRYGLEILIRRPDIDGDVQNAARETLAALQKASGK